MRIFTTRSVIVLSAAFLFAYSTNASAGQSVPMRTLVKVMQAEDELRFDKDLKVLLKDKNDSVKIRAALAAGRIGDPIAIEHLAALLDDKNSKVAEMSFFAIGEIESDEGAAHVLKALNDSSQPSNVRASAIEAAGKIGAASKNEETKRLLGAAILRNLTAEHDKDTVRSKAVILHGITAVLRTKPSNPDSILSKLLAFPDGRVRADAANTIARLSLKTVNAELKSVLVNDDEPIARANAARALGAAEDKTAIALMQKAAFEDKDLRVRVNAYSALGRLGDRETGSRILKACEDLFAKFEASDLKIPNETNELLSAVSAVGAIMKGTEDEAAVRFLAAFSAAVDRQSSEIEIALVRVSPKYYSLRSISKEDHWQAQRAVAQAFGFAATLEDSEDAALLKKTAIGDLSAFINSVIDGKVKPNLAFPDVLNAYARFKQDDLAAILRQTLRMDDLIIRAASADLLGDSDLVQGGRKLENYFALRLAYMRSENDMLNDASLSALSGLKKQFEKLKDEKDVNVHGFETLKKALNSPDYLVRRRAIEIAKEIGFDRTAVANHVSFSEKGNSRVKRANYRRAALRKKASAVFTTAKGNFTIEFFPEAAPLTVENFINLAKSGYFNGLEIHRVVPNFVMQDGDPRGDGSGGPGWHIRCEVNRIPYERGTVGMALSGKDTGGSQWFVAHSPQPHLDGGYTVFGKVNETGMKVVDDLARGDIIKRVRIVE